MNVFISWSGEQSRQVAQLLKRWLKCVLQATNPWVSTDDIERGALWFQDISNSLSSCSVGILCLTKENRNAPWILFEAGGLLKGLSANRVCTLLVDLEPKDIEPPLSQFNHTVPTYESIYQLISMLNSRLDYGKLDEKTLETVYQTYWPTFEAELHRILKTVVEKETEQANRTGNDLLTEILYTVRSVEQQLKKVSVIESARITPQKIEFSPWEEDFPVATMPPTFEKGDQVVHKAFGIGRIDDIRKFGNDLMLIINFEDSGVKNIVYSIAVRNDLLIKATK